MDERATRGAAGALPAVRVAPDATGAAARALVEALEAAHHRSGSARLAVAGGSAIGVLGAARAALPAEVWERLRLTWVDERCVPFAHPDSSRGEAYRRGALSAEAPPGYELPLVLDDEVADPRTAVERVTRALGGAFGGGLDVTLLGMGEDGHVASLFPGHAALGATEAAVVVEDSPKPPPRRVTLTLPTLRSAGAHVLYCAGAGKRAALARLLAGDEALPAAALRGVVVVTDQDLDDEDGRGRA